MTLLSRLAQGTALAVLANPAFAAITADDVWANQVAYFNATGLDVDGTLTRDGSTVTVSGIGMTYTLPMGFGLIFVRAGDMTLTENADTTVSITYAPQSTLAIGGDFDVDGDQFTLRTNFTVTRTGFVSTASGVPTEITYDTTMDMLDFALDMISIYPDPGLGDYEANAFVTMQDLVSSTRISVGDNVVLWTDTTSAATVYDVSFEDEYGSFGGGTGSVNLTDSSAEIVLPRTPLDIMLLAAAFRDGLSITVQSTAVGSHSRTVQRSMGDIFSDQNQSVDQSDQSFLLNQNGLSLTTSGQGILFEIAKDMSIPMPITATLARAELSFAMPISASPEPQPVGFAFALRDLVVNDAVWELFDPSRILTRDPATFAFAIDGTVRNSVDLFDFASFEGLVERIEDGEMPVELTSLNATGLDMQAVGATASGEAAFTFDNTDLVTFDGLPRPIGTGSIIVTGANALMDKAAQLGLVAESPNFQLGLGLRYRF